jgi:hypothetical protein
MENEKTTKQNNDKEEGTQDVALTRQQKIEEFLLNPDKTIFKSLEDFNDSIKYIQRLLGNLDLNDLEKIQGENGKSPELGVDYLTEEDLDKIDRFIQDRVNAHWSSYPTPKEIDIKIENKVASEVAKIPRVKGELGTPGKPGVNGSPDTAEQILEKLRSLPKNKRINVSDIRGLQAELNRIAQDSETSIEELRDLVNSFQVTIPAQTGNGGGITDINGLITEGANINITGSGTLADPFVINAVGMGLGDVVGPNGATSGNIAEFDGATGLIIKDSGKKVADFELIANKTTSLPTDGTSDTKYPSAKAVKDYADSLVAGLLDYRGAYDASVNTFPATGGSGSAGTVMKGDMWIISVAGTLGGSAVQIGDSAIANVDTPGQTAGNWNILNSNITYVPEDVANKKTTMTGNEASNTFYLTAKAIYDWATGLFVKKDPASTPGNIMQFDANGDAHDYGWNTSSFAPPRPTTAKVTLVDADEVTGNDSANTFSQIRTTWTNVKVFLKTWIDGMTSTFTNKTLNDITNYVDADALHLKVFLNLGSASTIGMPVYSVTWNGANSAVEIGKARANAVGTMPCIGLMETAGADGTVGSVRVSGLLENVNTNAWSEGTALYVSPTTAGVLTSTKPVGVSDLTQRIGTVIRQHATLGIIEVMGAGRVNDVPNTINMIGSINEAKGVDIASATTTDIGAATGNFVDVIGTTTITGLGTIQAGTRRIVRFTGALLLTHNATSLILPTSANITTVAGDTATFESLGSGNWVCVSYQRKDGSSLLGLTPDGTQTENNKRINPRLVTAASYTTDTGTSLSVATCDQFEVTAQAGALKLNNPGGTPLGGQKLIVRIKDNGTARALTYDTQFRAMGNALPSTTVISKTVYMGFIFNATDTKWDLVAVAQEV